jgi:hypothetical protein
VADPSAILSALVRQAHYCLTMDAPITARVCSALARGIGRETATGRRLLDWPGEPTADAVPLRLVGGLHALARAEPAGALAEVFAGAIEDEAAVRSAVLAAMAAHDAALLPWLDGPPQTNEPGRAAGLMLGMMALAARFGGPLEVLEIGSSAGLNLLIDRYRFDLGGVAVGPADAPVTLPPAWRGPPPAGVAPRFHSVRGVDVQPVDATDPAQAERLAAYVWADQPERLARLEGAVAMLRAGGVDLAQGDAADWLAARLAEPQPHGVVRVLMHSVVWQYLGPARQARIAALMAAAGAVATAERPLGWVRFEPDRGLNPRQEVWVQHWPEGAPAVKIAHSHAHGAWVERL